ncbi:kelch repeat and BTB domain-containing protein 11 [Narcine bancroftii]|uniref:kelch repeat and BTB domain-containing protein 11 n=1 Tax=Narcine bancroftii TaxID=1343680 RepID=UPI0038316FD6
MERSAPDLLLAASAPALRGADSLEGASCQGPAGSGDGAWPSQGDCGGRSPATVMGEQVARQRGGAGGRLRDEHAGEARPGSPQGGETGASAPDNQDAACGGFGSSLCFAAPGGEQETPACAREKGSVVKSQQQINHGGLREEEAATARWSLEPAGGAAPEDTPPDGGQPEPDLVVEVAGCRLRAHKAVLCARSEYFRARRSRQVVRVRGVGLPAMRALLDYAYGAGLRAPTLGAREGSDVDDVDPQAAAALLAAAHALQMPGAALAAVQALKAQLRVRTCGQLLALAKQQRMPELGDVALGFMSDHYLAILREPAVYGRLSAAERDLILKRREASGPPCLVVAEFSDVYERPGGSRPVSREGSRPQSPCSPERELNGPAPDGDARWLYRRDAETGAWRRLSRVPEAAAESRGCGVCALHGYLFVAGGTRGARPSARVFAYNPATGGWAEARAMTQARSQLRLAALEGLLYAVGGECVLAVERYDPRADRWRAAAPLPRGAFAVAPEAASCGGRLYLTGGSLSGRLLAYDPRLDEWHECPASPAGGGGRAVGLVARAHWLYRLEVERGQRLVAVQRYNTVARVWAQAASLRPGPGPVQPFRCALQGRSVYCVSKAVVVRFELPEDGDQRPGEDAFSCCALGACAQAQGPLYPVFLAVPERLPDQP